MNFLLLIFFSYSKTRFSNSFTREPGKTRNLRFLKSHLKTCLTTDFSLLSVAFEVGFNNQSYYSMAFKKHFGETPLEFKKRNTQL